ncbi:DNA breaking-rejoining protein [Chitinibacter bivalviorum]|uniref:DNA breaking-rejoining protein n=1 Tax=Chitinibacter bivalviorum TaxID=2739434 RepID=A0A7H9BMZ9_9NEIS|nr:DNA breaking-rejoining protein [Chitinibacter bivalviorum]
MASAVVFLQAHPIMAQDQIVKQVHFAKGSSGSIINDKIKGYQFIDYKLVAKAGQIMTVDLKTSNRSNYFNILQPGVQDEAFFIGQNEGEHFSGALPANGEYTIRVYLMRSAARRNEAANFTLNVALPNPLLQPVTMPK